MKVAIQSGLRLAGSAPLGAAPPTAHRIRAGPVPCEFELPSGGSLFACNPPGFAAVREVAGVAHASFFDSLTQEELTGGGTQASGKSGSIFWFSRDGRFVLKTVAEEELQNLLLMLPKYARHLRDHRDSLLIRYLGAYRLTPSKGADVVRIVVMNNVLEGGTHHKVYDLKGTTEDRWVQELEGRCLKDVNFEPITISTNVQINERLHAALHADTCFLERLHIMDYSLLLSIRYLASYECAAVGPKPINGLTGGLEGTAHRENSEGGAREACVFRVGLIDVLTTYDLKKQAAHVLKSSTIGHFCDIDTEPPDVYARRLRGYLARKLPAEAAGASAGAGASAAGARAAPGAGPPPAAAGPGPSAAPAAAPAAGAPAAAPELDLLGLLGLLGPGAAGAAGAAGGAAGRARPGPGRGAAGPELLDLLA